MSDQKRSARYPSAPWNECIDFIRKLDGLGARPVSLEILSQACGIKNPKTKSFQGKISSARMFGLIDVKSGTVSLSNEGHALLYPTEPDIRPLELELFARPRLYKDLLDTYEGKSLPRRDLFENILVKDYSLSDISKKRAAECFIASAEELGILVNGVISYNNAVDSAETPTTAPASAASIEQQPATSTLVPAPETAIDKTPVLTLSIPITTGEGFIEIRIPESAARTDLLMAQGMLNVYLQSKGISSEGGDRVDGS